MRPALLILTDVLAVIVLVFVLYFPRYRRRDMVVAILGVNVGVLAVATLLSRADATLALGLGLFGVLSIIRLRSAELDQEEVVYYFSALALGMLGGVAVTPEWVTPVLSVAILVALYIGDHPRMFASSRNQVVRLDEALTDERALRDRLEGLLGARVYRIKVRRVDLVNNSTVVDVRYRVRSET